LAECILKYFNVIHKYCFNILLSIFILILFGKYILNEGDKMNKTIQIINKVFTIGAIPILLALTPRQVSGKTTVTYVPDKEQVKEIVLENKSLRYTITINNAVKLVSILDKSSGYDYLEKNEPLIFTSVYPHARWLDNVGYQLFTVEEVSKEGRDGISIWQQSSYVENSWVVVQEFSLGEGHELYWKSSITSTATGGRSYREERTRPSTVKFPVIQDLILGHEEEMNYFYPSGNMYYIDNKNESGFYLTNTTDPKVPTDIYNLSEDRGVYFHVLETNFDWSFDDKDDIRNHAFKLVQEPGEETVVMDCRIGPHEGDWHAAFDAYKKHIYSTFDFKYYERPVQQEYRKKLVSHFTFLYGHDIYNPKTNEFEIDRFLDEGEANFGGYDYMLLWHDYPRMGVDNRNQFAMYEDLPGGLAGLRLMVDKAHARGVHVYIPYKPWDIMVKDQNHYTEEARISKAIGADGVFLDTMRDSEIAFREALDAVNPDNVFVSEGRPSLADAQLVTGSWNQSGAATNTMPNVDLFRFLLPQHNVHNINRGARDREQLIHNALFNGTGFIVWEDIFGEINQYSWNERILIHRYSRILRENNDAYLTDNPIPLVRDLREDIYINAFPVSSKCVYPVYQNDYSNVSRTATFNEGSTPAFKGTGGRDASGRVRRLIGPFIEVDHPQDWHYIDVWNHRNVGTEKVDGKTRLVFLEEAPDKMSCVVGMPKNLKVDQTDGSLKIRVTNPIENSRIQINTAHNLTMMEEEKMELSGNDATVNLSDLDLDYPHKVLVKLMQDDVMIDQVIVDAGWYGFNEK